MSRHLKICLWLIMTTAMTSGFLHHLVPPSVMNFERLHIFLFNLCSGGTLLIYFTEGRSQLTIRGRVFLFFALVFALCAFLKWYLPTLFMY